MENGWRLDTPIEDSILRRFLVNQADAQDTLVAAAAGRSSRSDGVALSDLGVPSPYLNQAVLMRPLAGADDPVLDEITSFYRRHSPAAVLSAWPTPDLSTRGWLLVGHPMFVIHGGGLHIEAPPPDVSVRSAETVEDLGLVERVAAEGYPVPEIAGLRPNRVYGAAVLAAERLHVRIGCLDGAPAGAAVSHVAHGVVNLCFAATLPAARRRGVWQALVAARCADAPDLPAVAFTSDHSRPGFVRMGFLPVTRFTLWAAPA